MAKIVSLIQYVGKAGNTVGQKGPKGGVVFKQKAASVSNPKTAAQMNQRARFKLATVVASMLGEVGRVSLQANGFRRTDRGELVKRIMRNVSVSQNQAQLAYALRLINNPSYAENISVTVEATATAYTATFSGASTGEVIAKAILVYDRTTGLWRHATALDTLTVIGIGKDANEAGHSLEVYAYGIVLEPKTDFANSNLGEVNGDGVGYLLNIEAVGSENYDFSPTISALLTIAGDGSQTGGEGGSSGSGSGGTSTQGSYVLTLAASPNDGGTLTASVNGNAVASGSQVPAGSEVRLTATPAEGKQLSGITMNSGSGNTAVQNSKFNMPAANTTVTATFADASSGGGGVNGED